jgi:hypothetical protein
MQQNVAAFQVGLRRGVKNVTGREVREVLLRAIVARKLQEKMMNKGGLV